MPGFFANNGVQVGSKANENRFETRESPKELFVT
jgi:hypothetical protein